MHSMTRYAQETNSGGVSNSLEYSIVLILGIRVEFLIFDQSSYN